MCRIALRGVPGAEVVSKEEQIQIGNAHDDPNPDAPRLPADESFSKGEDASNPKKLAGNQRNEEGGEEQESEGPVAPIGEEHESAKSNPRENDHAHALVSSEETDHCLCRLRFLEDHSAAIIDLEPFWSCRFSLQALSDVQSWKDTRITCGLDPALHHSAAETQHWQEHLQTRPLQQL